MKKHFLTITTIFTFITGFAQTKTIEFRVPSVLNIT